MRVCMYKGDKEDEYCVNCDGIKVMFDGTEVSATECAGYSPSNEHVDELDMPEKYSKSKQMEELDLTDDVPNVNKEVEEPPFDVEEKKEEKPKKKKTTKKTNKSTNKVIEEVKQDIEKKTDVSISNSIPKEITVSSAITINHKDTFYKLMYSQTNLLKEGITEDELEIEREKLWAIANNEVDNQVSEILK